MTVSEGTSMWKILRKVHRDERGAVSLETVLVIAVIALPVLILMYKFAWPAIKNYFWTRMEEIDIERVGD